MYFWFSHVCAHQLDVQKTNFSITQLYRIEFFHWNAGLRMAGLLALHLCDIVIEVLCSTQSNANSNGPQLTGKPARDRKLLPNLNKRKPNKLFSRVWIKCL